MVDWTWSLAGGGTTTPSGATDYFHNTEILNYVATYVPTGEAIHFMPGHSGTGTMFMYFAHTGAAPAMGSVGVTVTDEDGNVIPAPAAICLLGLAGFASRRRRRS